MSQSHWTGLSWVRLQALSLETALGHGRRTKCRILQRICSSRWSSSRRLANKTDSAVHLRKMFFKKTGRKDPFQPSVRIPSVSGLLRDLVEIEWARRANAAWQILSTWMKSSRWARIWACTDKTTTLWAHRQVLLNDCATSLFQTWSDQIRCAQKVNTLISLLQLLHSNGYLLEMQAPAWLLLSKADQIC